MCTSAFIKKHIFSLPAGGIFVTRDLLNYGRRAAVDQCIYRLVKTGRIIRLAWGLFMKDDCDIGRPSAMMVAKEKARAFGKQIYSDAADAAKLLGLTAFSNRRLTFAVHGHSSSFRYGKTTIYLKGICARKMLLGDDPVGLVIRALWQIGKEDCDKNVMGKAIAIFSRLQRLQFRQSCNLMPGWMTNMFKT